VIQMTSHRIAFRTDANSEIGTGHFMRCLTLADELKKHDAETCFVTRKLPAHLIQMLQERGIDLYELPEVDTENTDELPHAQWLKTSQHQDAIQTIEMLGKRKLDWLVVDHYAIGQRWETQLRKLANKIMVIDDLADRQHDCDVLLDQNFYQEMDARYVGKVPQNCKLLLGPTYALLREEFREARKCVKPRTGKIKNILVFFGGVDIENLTTMALKALIVLNLGLRVDVVIGRGHPHTQEIEVLCKLHNFSCHIQTKHVAVLMARADLAIGAGGSSNWERCCLGLPSIVIASANNQVFISKELNTLNACIYLGWFGDINSVMLQNAIIDLTYSGNLLRNISSKAVTLVDGNGSINVVKEVI
jgi:UDP-2,4-diacetamido-2,4,6-trideoxy-beta-L-altropyranose hydrolase